MIASAQTLNRLEPPPLTPFFAEQQTAFGMSYGLGPAGYDIRIAEGMIIEPGNFMLASSLERFDMPDNLQGVVYHKSTWIRQGLKVELSLIQPGWRGYLTLELTNRSDGTILIKAGMPIAQVVFQMLDYPTERPYRGRYQDQKAGPRPAVLEAAK